MSKLAKARAQTGNALRGQKDMRKTNLAMKKKMAKLEADAARWRAFRARDEFRDLDFRDFQDMFREDADDVIDKAMRNEPEVAL
jgi:hypothetical protein